MALPGTTHVNGVDFKTILMDTQGLNDPRFNNAAAVSGNVFITAALLSSYLIYNQIGVINSHQLELLAFVGQVSEKLVLTDADQALAKASF